MAANLQTIYNGASNVGMNVTNVNALLLSEVVFLCGTGMTVTETALDTMWMQAVNCAFDTNNGINMSGGIVNITTSYFSNASSSNYCVTQTGGVLSISDSWFLNNGAPGIAINANDSVRPGVTCNINNCTILQLPSTVSFLTATTTSGTLFVTLNDCQFPYLAQNTNATAVISITDSTSSTRLNFSNNIAFDKGTGTGNLVAITTDGFHVVSNNTFLGWGLSLPANSTNLIAVSNQFVNPLGISTGTVGASPATLIAGPSGATYYFLQSATNTATVSLGGNVVGTMSSATIPVVVNMGANESCVVTWVTTAPTYVKSKH
jgi:hypothetical protein